MIFGAKHPLPVNDICVRGTWNKIPSVFDLKASISSCMADNHSGDLADDLNPRGSGLVTKAGNRAIVDKSTGYLGLNMPARARVIMGCGDGGAAITGEDDSG